MMPDPLPTGGCFFRLLNSGHSCGCQRFRPRRRPRSDSTGEDDDQEECRCQHDACFHKVEAPATPVPDVYRSGRAQSVQQSGLVDTFEHRPTSRGTNMSVSTVMNHEEASLRRSMVTLSAASGTTTERDPSTSVTPSTGLLPAFPPRRPPLFVAPASNNRTSRGSGRDVVRRPSREVSVAPASESMSSSKTTDVKLQVTRLSELAQALKSNQMSQQDQLDLVEGLPSIIEELADKVDLLDNEFATIETRHVDFEEKMKNELNDRLGAIESFMRSQMERKRGRKHESEFETSSSIRGDRKRQRTREESEVRNSFVRTTTTSFTTTTSTSTSVVASSPPVDQTFQKRIQFELEKITRRLVDVEKSAGPSVMRPWEIEIVMIPPSPLIAGAWHDGTSSAASTQFESSELRPSGPLAIAASKASQHTPSMVIGPTPRSFGPNTKQYLRLQSRGFIRRLHITGPTAKDVSLVIEYEFGDLLDWCASFSASSQKSKSQATNSTSSQRTARAFGFSTSPPAWQPLRKIYKQTILEYISETELATPSLWTVEYLKGNCMQRSANRTAVYIMPTQMSPRITWGDIQSLPVYTDENAPSLPDQQQMRKVLPTSSSQDERIWAFDRHLDGKSHANILGSQNPSGGGGVGSFCSLPFADFSKLEPVSLDERHCSPASAGSRNPSFTNTRSMPQSLQIYRSTQNTASQQQLSQPTPPKSNPHLQPRHSSNLNLRQNSQRQGHLREKPRSPASTTENPRLTLHPASSATLFSKPPKSTSSAPEPRRRRPSSSDPPPPSPPASEPSHRLPRLTSSNTRRVRDRTRSRSRHRSHPQDTRQKQRHNERSPTVADSPPPTYHTEPSPRGYNTIHSGNFTEKSFESSGIERAGRRRSDHREHPQPNHQHEKQDLKEDIRVKKENVDDKAPGVHKFDSLFGSYEDDEHHESSHQPVEDRDETTEYDGGEASTEVDYDDDDEDDDEDDDGQDGSVSNDDTEPETSFSELLSSEDVAHSGEGQLQSQMFPPSATSGSLYPTLPPYSFGGTGSHKTEQEVDDEDEDDTEPELVDQVGSFVVGVADSGDGGYVSV